MEKRTTNGIHFLRLKGNQVERARAHAELLREVIHEGALKCLAKKNETLIRSAPLVERSRLLQFLAIGFYRHFFLRRLKLGLSHSEHAWLKASAQAAGVDLTTAQDVLFQADAMLLLVRGTLMKHMLPEWVPGALPGCTTGVALAQHTKARTLLMGRNFDYPIVGPWEKHSTVLFNEPSEAGEIPYVSLTTAGIHSGGVTSINHEGISLVTHAHFGKNVSFSGKPVVVIGDEIIRKAKNLDQAIDIARKNKTCGNWAFIVGSGHENNAAVIEMTPDKVRVRGPQDGFLVHSNFFHHPDLFQDEILLSGGYFEDLRGRFSRMTQILKNTSPIEPLHLMQALGDHQDHTEGVKRVFGNTLSVVTTTASVVFQPEALKFWLAARKASPVGLGPFVEVDIEKFWKMPEEECAPFVPLSEASYPPSFLAAVASYREAYVAFHMARSDPQALQKTLNSLVDCLKSYENDGHVWVQAGLIALKLGQVDRARSFFESSRGYRVSDHVRGVSELFSARCLDLLGLRVQALPLYEKGMLTIQEPKLKRAFERGFKRPFKKKQIQWIVLDLQFPDVFEYN